jgi:small nuclear ribonucleoprotein (snRNP)-like protein
MQQNRIVVRYRDGRSVKGHTADFLPSRPSFHVLPADADAAAKGTVEVALAELKAVFFVKEFSGNAAYHESKAFRPGQRVAGRKIRVELRDGEILVGTTMGYQPSRPGFFLVPADPNSNNERCYVVSAAVRKVEFV